MTVVNALILGLICVFAIEVMAGVRAQGTAASRERRRPGTTAVLIPAHNEASVIEETLRRLVPQLQTGDRLLVVADNCDDDTADIARSAGADVFERSDTTRRGKGYALDAGLRQLAQSPPDVVVIVDADCIAGPGSISELATLCAETQRPVQAQYLMVAPPDAGIGLKIAEFAFVIKNKVRPLGLRRLGLPCQLTGSGMAFPWALIQTADLAHGHIVEDMKLGVDMARAGAAPLFCPAARIVSTFPMSESGARSQRRRWEEGHLEMVLSALKLLPSIILKGRLLAIALLVDLLVPPITFLVLVLLLATLISFALAWISVLPVAVAITSWALLVFSVVVAWRHEGRAILPFASLALIPSYVLSKLGIYGRFALRRKTEQWVKTDRNSDS